MKQLGAGTLFGWKSGHISGSGSKSNVFGPVISVILTVVVARLLTTAWWRICSRRCRSSPTRFRPDPTLKLFLAGIYDTSIFCIKIYRRHFQEIMTIFFLARNWLACRICSWMFFLYQQSATLQTALRSRAFFGWSEAELFGWRRVLLFEIEKKCCNIFTELFDNLGYEDPHIFTFLNLAFHIRFRG